MAEPTWPPGIRPMGYGLQIRLYKQGRHFYAETLPGNPHDPKLLRQALTRQAELKARLKAGLPLEPAETEVHQEQLFIYAAQDYLDTLQAQPSTLADYAHRINAHWVPAFRTHQVADITQADIKRVLARTGLVAKTQRNLLIPLAGVLDHAGVRPNPARGIRLRREQKAEVERYNPTERAALLDHLEGQALVYFAILFGCGLRPGGEVLALTWADYDGEQLLVDKTISRRRLKPTTKTYHARRVYVPTWVRPILEAHPTRFAGGHIFQNSIGGFHRDADRFNEAWAAAHKKARLRYRVPYTCRHTRASELLSQGIDPADAAQQLGHSVEMFLRTYARFIQEFAQDQDLARFEGVAPRPRRPIQGGGAVAQIPDKDRIKTEASGKKGDKSGS